LATTKQFLDDLGLSSLEDLPPLQQMGEEQLPGSLENAAQLMEHNLQASLDQASIDFSIDDSADSSDSQAITVQQADAEQSQSEPDNDRPTTH
jgi:segregation and condensation protein B